MHSYQVFDSNGRLVLQATADCRYDKQTEHQMLEGGYTIKLNGKRITKKEVK